jgi:phosphatidylserine/phosphatidylglycerophosphate/cardiolipin synthase-like enzyme/uncharacterized membrane protein YdjX (TVP38/TMEM64 family)
MMLTTRRPQSITTTPALHNDGAVLRAGRNAWRVERARRAALLADGAAYFPALRQAMRKARRAIYIVGWDIDSRTLLVDESGRTGDDLPPALGDFLSALVRRNPDLTVKLLLWDYSLLFSLEREPLPLVALQWNTPPQIELCFDDVLPVGSSHHEKIVVIDDAVAFSGGLDLTIRRWDSSRHLVRDCNRVDPSGHPYPPFHDIQMLVDGAAAKALSELVRQRWKSATSETLSPLPPSGDPWPNTLKPDFRDVDVAISRTRPAYAEGPEIREVESLFADMVDAACRSIYIENQFLTCMDVAERIARRLQAVPSLELLIIGPKRHHTWWEHSFMQAGRARFIDTLRRAGVNERVRLLYPQVRRGRETIEVMIHSKLMIVDDRLLRVGSANLCNRSMGTDSECDLTIEAESPGDRLAIRRVRERLLAEHCHVAPARVAAFMEATGSLVATVDVLGLKAERLAEIDNGSQMVPERVSPMEAVADPARPLGFTAGLLLPAAPVTGRWAAAAKLGVTVATITLVALLWRYSELADMTRPDVLQEWFASIADEPWTPVMVIAAFVLGGLVLFPVTILIAATAVTFGIWPGLAFAAVGALASAIITYGLGRWFGAAALRQLLGPRLNRISQGIARQGIPAVTAVRLVPIAPFTIVNLVAGAMRIPLLDYSVGTVLGLAPGVLVMSLLGDQLLQIVTEPSPTEIAILLAVLLAWAALSVGLQGLVAKARR